MRSGKMAGEGKYVWKDGTAFTGTFDRNVVSGHGAYVWPNGDTYTGEVKDGLRHGHGVYVSEKYRYEGEWKGGLRDGQGTLTYIFSDPTAESHYKGGWKEGLKSGYGEYLYKSGNLYKGHWLRDKKHGQGTMYWRSLNGHPANEKYTGNWKEDLPSGFGTHIWLDARGENRVLRNRYVGNWKAGLRDGHGMFFYANGSMYVGEWKQNLKHGEGKFVYENGDEYVGGFQRDRMTDRAVRGEVKTTVGVPDVFLESAKSKRSIKSPRSPNAKTKTEERPGERPQTRYYVTERVREELEGNPYDPMVDVSDLICLEQIERLSQPDYMLVDSTSKLQEIQDEINKVLLTHNTELNRWYRHYSRDVDCPDIEEGFMMVSMQFWHMLRDCKVISPWFSLAQYNRLYMRGKGAGFSLRYDPMKVAESSWEPEAAGPITGRNPEGVVPMATPIGRREMDQGETPQSQEAELDAEDLAHGQADVDVHDPMRPMLFRHFAEAIIRAAWVCYQAEHAPLKDKLARFFTEKLVPALTQVQSESGEDAEESVLAVTAKPSICFRYEKETKQFDKPLFAVFLLHSLQGEREGRFDRHDDCTVSVDRFIEMAARTLEAAGAPHEIDLIGIVERDFPEKDKADFVLSPHGSGPAPAPSEQKEQPQLAEEVAQSQQQIRDPLDPDVKHGGNRSEPESREELDVEKEAQIRAEAENRRRTKLYEEHVKGLLRRELIFYEFKELVIELALLCMKEAEKEEEALGRFVGQWIQLNGSREVRRRMPRRRLWVQTEKEGLYVRSLCDPCGRVAGKRKEEEEKRKKAIAAAEAKTEAYPTTCVTIETGRGRRLQPGECCQGRHKVSQTASCR